MCLQNRALPLVTREMEFEDLHSVGARDLGTENFECLPLRTSMEAPWLSKFFKKPAKWWLHNGSKVPLVREIRETIETGKVRKGGASRLSKRADIVVAINVRGKVILVQNTTLPATLCWPTNTDDGDEGIEIVKRFLEEFKNDLERMGNSGVASSSGSSVGQASKRPHADQETQIIQNALRNLREHSQCLSAYYLPSRCAIMVTTKDKARQEFCLKALAQKRKKALDRDDDQAWVGGPRDRL